MRASEWNAMRIARARPEDIPELASSMQGCEGAPHWPADAFVRLIESAAGEARRGVVWVLRSDDGVLWGWLAATVLAGSSEMEFVWIEPAFRGRGLGAELVRQWLHWAAEEGASEALLEVRASNAAALSLYRREGFCEQGRRRAYYRDPEEDAVLMSRPLGADDAPGSQRATHLNRYT